MLSLKIVLYQLQRQNDNIAETVAHVTVEIRTIKSLLPGRPKYNISEDILIRFRELGYSWKEIAEIMLVSRWTIYRRVREFGLETITGCNNISNEELDTIIRYFKHSHDITVGRSLILGHLKSLGLRIQHHRVTKSLVRIDPVNSRIRWAQLIKRRKYSVPGPNTLMDITVSLGNDNFFP